MARVVRLTVLTGPHKDQKYCLRGTACCLIGRSDDCFVHFDGEGRDLGISRRHCQVILEPTSLTLKDMQSRNGTYLNGKRIETAQLPLPSDDTEATCEDFSQCSLLTMGGTTLRIDVVDCPPAEIASPDQPDAVHWEDGECAKSLCPLKCI